MKEIIDHPLSHVAKDDGTFTMSEDGTPKEKDYIYKYMQPNRITIKDAKDPFEVDLNPQGQCIFRMPG